MAAPLPPISSPTLFQRFEVQPSNLEREATANFVNAGQNSNRFVAVWQAIPAIAASSIMIIGNPLNGILKGSVTFFQGNFSDGVSEGVCGIFNATRSLYNVARVFWTAVFGLLARETMYGAMVPQPTEIQLRERAVKQLTQDQQRLLVTVGRLQAQEANLQRSAVDTAAAVQQALNKPGIGVNAQLAATQTIIHQIFQEVGATKDPTLSEPYLELKRQYTATSERLEQAGLEIEELRTRFQKQLDQLAEQHRSALADAKNPALNGSDERVEQLTTEHKRVVTQLTEAHEEALRKANERTDNALESLEGARKSIDELTAQHERVLQDKQKEFELALQDARDPEKNDTVKKLEQLTRENSEARQLLEQQHLEVTRALEEQVRDLTSAKEKVAAEVIIAKRLIETFREQAKEAEKVPMQLRAELDAQRPQLEEAALLYAMIERPDAVTAGTHRGSKSKPVSDLRDLILSYQEFLSLFRGDFDKLKELKVAKSSTHYTFWQYVTNLQQQAETQSSLADSNGKRADRLQSSLEDVTAQKDRKDQQYKKEKEKADRLEDEVRRLQQKIATLEQTPAARGDASTQSPGGKSSKNEKK